MLMLRRIKGYTGDCCGTVFLLCELAFYLTAVALLAPSFTL
jgi:adenosylcobinamide-GDP ribazoletransferase